LDSALQAEENVSVRRITLATLSQPETREKLASPNPPVLIFDRLVPPDSELPDVPALFIGCRPSLPEGVTESEIEAFQIIDWDRTHPLHRDLAFTDVKGKKGKVFNVTGTERFRWLIETDKGTVAGVLQRKGTSGGLVPAVLIGFDILETNWPWGHYSFPLFFSNALQWLGVRYGGAEVSLSTGESIARSVTVAADTPDRPEIEYRLPNGDVIPAVIEPSGAAICARTKLVGIYELLVGGEVEARVGVNLVDRAESALTPLEKIDFEGFKVETKGELVDQQSDLWYLFALAGLAMLLVEWYVYHRRVYV
ncbi:MAG: hypothetical protein AAF517_17665, partial [Planctomycetota bacterium]